MKKHLALSFALMCGINVYAADYIPDVSSKLVMQGMDEDTFEAIHHYSSQTNEGYIKARELLDKRIEKGIDPLANYLRAIMNYKGLGGEVDKVAAHLDFIYSADEYPDSAYMAGYMYLYGDEIPIDIEQGAEFMELAANNGQMHAQYQLAKLSLEQSKVEENQVMKIAQEKMAFNYSAMCSKQKNIECMKILAEVFEKGLGEVPKSLESAARLKQLISNLSDEVKVEENVSE